MESKILKCGLRLKPHSARLLDRGSLNLSMQTSVAQLQHVKTSIPSISIVGQLCVQETGGDSSTSSS